MVTKLCSPGGPSICNLAEETGIPRGTLYYWLNAYGKGPKRMPKEKRPENWTPKERLQAVFEASGLSESELGVFLRKNGLFSHHIEEWKQEALNAASDKPEKTKRGRPRKNSDLVRSAK